MSNNWYGQIFSTEWSRRIEQSEVETGVLFFRDEGPLPLHQSKIGGIGYFPKDELYPIGRSGKPLSLLAQFNFDELPTLPNFPTTGILSFYIDLADDLLGLNLDDYRNQDGYRVFYFDQVTKEAYTREELALIDQPEYTVVKGEYAVSCEVKKLPILDDNYEFTQQYGEEYYDLFEALFGEELDEKLDELHEQSLAETGDGLIGGHPSFTQEDPRKYSEELQGDRLLFQLYSTYGEGVDILWGDSGIGQFFIHPDDLKAKRFERAWYNWDCY